MTELDNSTILVTGGTGSFGQKFTEIALSNHNPKAIRIFSRGELLQFDMQQKFKNESRLRYFIGDVRDRERVYRAMSDVDIVIHAAALKQVPTCEYNPIEAVRTNIDGTINIIDAAIDNGVKKVIAISTDKAAQPINLYGATKLVMERLFTQANVYTGRRKTRFSCTRYGNVIGSRGSVVPLFIKQSETGAITITNEKMARFWVTLDQGVNFVIECVERMRGGEIFVPKLPSMNVVQLADVVAPGAKKEIIGIRPGEKLNEVLLTEDEARHAKEHDNYFVIEPEDPSWRVSDIEGGKTLPEEFSYTSDNNSYWLTKEELKELLDKI
jgi:UDP-N-acetylglucosamine 4,6-dehydratase